MRTLALALSLVLASLAAPGCVSASGPDAEQLAAVRDADSAIAIVRVVVTSNAGQLPPFDSALESQCITVGVGDGAGGPVEQIDDLESFSDEALAQGWIYLLLPPGEHVVAFNPPTMWDARSDAERWSEAAHWRFTVPPDTPVVFLGTMQLHCRAEASDFGGVRLREIRAQKLHDGSPAAVALAARHLPDLPAPVRVPLERRYRNESDILAK